MKAALQISSRGQSGINFVLRWFWVLLFVVIVFGPLLALLSESGHALFSGDSEWLSLVIPTGRRLGLLLRSIGLAAGVAVSGVLLGILGGTILWRWDKGWGSYLRWLVLVLAAVPPYIHALAWTSGVFSVSQWLQGLGINGIQLQGWVGSWWVQLMSLAPIAVALALVGLKSVESTVIEAGRVVRSDIVTLWRIILPLAAPAILAGGGLLFLLSLLDYSVPSLFNLNVYSLEIFAEFSSSSEPARAFMLALPLLIITAVVILVSLSALRNAAQSPAWRRPTWQTSPAWPVWFVALLAIAIVTLLAQVVVPLLSLMSTEGIWDNMASTLASSHQEIVFTLWVALLAALLSLPVAFAAARRLVTTRKWERLWWVLVVLPLAIPPPLVGIGLISLWNRSVFAGVYGSSLMPVLAAMARFLPLATIVLVAQLRRTDPLLLDAARVLQPSRFQRLMNIHLPMLMPGLLAAAGIIFALTLGELGATLLVAPPGQATLSMRIYNFLHYGASGSVAGLCLMMAVAILLVGGLVAAMLGWSRFSPMKTTRLT